ncbi:hypothetical protein RYH73_06715 [Olivibacter sp. CPCC 100613]|uniref:hypothetical protein n=1 Tax=Olivibacter sp. CPCC 100613 TaxID=3079931 RepID=UPI002FF9A562
MKKLDLNNLGVEEMNAAELRTVEGGGLVNDLLFTFLADVVPIINDTLDFVKKTVANVLSTLNNLLW